MDPAPAMSCSPNCRSAAVDPTEQGTGLLSSIAGGRVESQFEFRFLWASGRLSLGARASNVPTIQSMSWNVLVTPAIFAGRHAKGLMNSHKAVVNEMEVEHMQLIFDLFAECVCQSAHAPECPG